MDILILDNGDKTDDRYTVIFGNREVYTMTADPLSPAGLRYLCDAVDLDRNEAGKPIAFETLPEEHMKTIQGNGGPLVPEEGGMMISKEVNADESMARKTLSLGRHL